MSGVGSTRMMVFVHGGKLDFNVKRESSSPTERVKNIRTPPGSDSDTYAAIYRPTAAQHQQQTTIFDIDVTLTIVYNRFIVQSSFVGFYIHCLVYFSCEKRSSLSFGLCSTDENNKETLTLLRNIFFVEQKFR